MSKSKLIITLVSEQTIPNVQFLKWYFSNNLRTVDLLFISTKKMEQKNKSLYTKNALSYLEKFISNTETIIVEENNIDDIKEKLNGFMSKNHYQSIVSNITGGTKVMSLALYECACTLQNSEIFYQPIGEDLQKLFPNKENFSVSELLTLDEYMSANGISYKTDNNCTKDYEYNKCVYDLVIEPNRDFIKGFNALQNNPWFKNQFKRKDFLDFTKIDDEKYLGVHHPMATKENMCNLVKSFGFNPEKIHRSEMRYITGGWFEEYVYQKLSKEKDLSDGKIALNVTMSKNDDKNELDVVYIDKKNRLNVIECKSFVDGTEGAKVLNDALYKLQAITKSKFGLTVESYLYTKTVIDKDSALNRAKEFRINIIDGTQI